MMVTLNRRAGHPIDRGVSVLVDLPHATQKPALAQLVDIVDAATHEPITGVLGMSLHFDCNPTRGNYEIWAVTEQFVDENDEPLATGVNITPQHHHEYFNGTLRTALFRYLVAGFTTGPTLDRAATWHRHAADENTLETKPSGSLVVFDVVLRNHLRDRVAAHHFEFRDDFVHFIVGSAQQVASFAAADIAKITTAPELRPLLVDQAQLRILRSAALWDAERTGLSNEPREYRQKLLDVLVQVLGMMPPADEDAATAQASPAGDDGQPNERTRRAAPHLDELVTSFTPDGPRDGIEHPAGFAPETVKRS